mmetsp:Transcript_42779/g.68686  ORF Transcript_42779/g.68686 Transcript_42779/m.68686 type:complete len:102 (+) Transcript_42779:284-589(+)
MRRKVSLSRYVWKKNTGGVMRLFCDTHHKVHAPPSARTTQYTPHEPPKFSHPLGSLSTDTVGKKKKGGCHVSGHKALWETRRIALSHVLNIEKTHFYHGRP